MELLPPASSTRLRPPQLARRTSGGGAVFHNEGNVNFGIYTHRNDYDPALTIELLRSMLEAQYGIAPGRLSTTTRHDLFLDGKKITGSAMRVGKQTALHHFTLLVDTKRSDIKGWLAPAGQYAAFTSSAVASVRSPVTTLAEAIDGFSDSPREVQAKMLRFIQSHGWALFIDLQRRKRDLRIAFDPMRETLAAASLFPVHVAKKSCGAFARGAADKGGPVCGEQHPTSDAALGIVDIPAEELLAASFVYAPGDRPQRGDLATVADLVAKHKSMAWLLHEPGMGRFTTVVRGPSTDVLLAKAGLSSQPPAFDGAMPVAVLATLLPPGAMAMFASMWLLTRVEHGCVATVRLQVQPHPGPDDGLLLGQAGQYQHDPASQTQRCDSLVHDQVPQEDGSPLGTILDAALHGLRLVDLVSCPAGGEETLLSAAVAGHAAAVLSRLADVSVADGLAMALGGERAAADAVERMALQLALTWASQHGFVRSKVP